MMSVNLTINGKKTTVEEGKTILEACRSAEIEVPTLCYLETLTPVNACRVCVVEVEGARVLAPACSRKAEEGMVVGTETPRVRHSRRLVLELLGSSVDLSLADEDLKQCMREYGATPDRFGRQHPSHEPGARDAAHPGHHKAPSGEMAATVAQPVKIDNELYVRDGSRCVLCYKCVEACGTDAQNTFAIAVAGRGFDARISTEFDAPLPDTACVYCGNCIGVCPTGALMFKTEHDMRQSGEWDESKQRVTRTICPYCGVGCTVDLKTQDNEIVTASSPVDSGVTRGMLCIKGRFGWQYVSTRKTDPGRE